MPASRIPIVAIVGRPNVGKSTLFNRYAGRRRALVDDQPGVTRDRIAEDVEVEGRRVLLVDTAGLDPDPESGLEAAVQAQARSAVSDADAILFVVDGQSGLLPEDEQLARSLHRADKPVALAVNKVDVPAHETRVAEFHALGFERVNGVSAEHGGGAWAALEGLVAELPDEPETEPEAGGIRIAVVGRPNVGKSSLVNRLAGQDRVVVSDVPGTTRDTVDIRVEQGEDVFTLVDTAGLRRPGRRDRKNSEPVTALMAVRALERADVALLVVDAASGVTDQDARVASLVRDRGRAAAVLANKRDLLEKGAWAGIRDALGDTLRFMPDAPFLPVSAKTGSGLDKVLPEVRRLWDASQRRLTTSELNRWLKDATSRHEPAMAQRGHRRRVLKFFYATQVAVGPPTFVLFCTEPKSVQTSYLRFLENRLREAFDFGGTPIRLRLRKRAESRSH